MSLRFGVVILPDLRWRVAADRFREAEQRGFHTAWTYDHLSWRTLRDGPWMGAIPQLAAAAAVTSTLRLGTLVTSPNFRHPALLAKDVMTLDDISGGRIELGVGAGSGEPSWDASALGASPLSPRKRFDRFAEFTDALDVMLREPSGSYAGDHYQAPDYRTLPGCVQQPRVPFTVAATGQRGMGIAARYASTWVTFGPLGVKEPEQWFEGVERQSRLLDHACTEIRHEPQSIRRMALVSLDHGWIDGTRSRWADFTARIEALGFTDVVVHWPRPDSSALPGCAPDVFDAISAGSSW
jgi:alkanesulfonate monooxygenase SsuD/methylene tetrahydromethanopterin reductase-like flavin-dependent oxidoreductase (luciferase family)